MAIVNFDFSHERAPADAKGVHYSAGWQTGKKLDNGEAEYAAGPRAYWIWETHKGMCLSDHERNGYDDSDFYMTVWNPEKGAPETVNYASTRGWSYPSYASYVDATPEVRAAYEAYKVRQRRISDIEKRRAVVRIRLELARDLGVTPAAIRRLEAAYGAINSTPVHTPSYRERTYGKQDHHSAMALAYGFRRYAGPFDKITQLAKSAKQGRLKNEFKRKLGQQVLDWLNDPQPRYNTPLSPKQLQWV